MLSCSTTSLPSDRNTSRRSSQTSHGILSNNASRKLAACSRHALEPKRRDGDGEKRGPDSIAVSPLLRISVSPNLVYCCGSGGFLSVQSTLKDRRKFNKSSRCSGRTRCGCRFFLSRY